MRHSTSSETPTLFPPDLLLTPQPVALSTEEKTPRRLAHEFVRWCWSAGGDFRNSPDRLNLRFWQQKNRMECSQTEEDEILLEARSLFLRKVEQAARKADASQAAD
jgi:hypothetical protein